VNGRTVTVPVGTGFLLARIDAGTPGAAAIPGRDQR
jgi:hypothetical protein